MKFSVIMPCHNAEAYVVKALRSVAKQTHPAHEVIVINDRSTDGSVAAITSSGVPVTLLHTDFGNAAAARNAGIEQATGEWIAFLDADDYWLSYHLAQAADLLKGDSDAAYMAHRMNILTGSYEPYEVPVPYGISVASGKIPADDYPMCFLGSGLAFYMSSVVVKRKRLMDVGMLDTGQIRRHDIEMWLRVIAGHTWAFHPNPSSVYQTDTPNSISSQVASRELWFYKALKKNANLYPGKAMQSLLAGSARSALASSITDGTKADRKQASAYVWGSLSFRDRIIFSLGKLSPTFLAFVNRQRRKFIFRQLKHRHPRVSAK